MTRSSTRWMALLASPVRAALLCAFVGLVVGLPARAALVDRVAAVVDEEVIALSEVYELGGEYIEQRCQGEPGCTTEMEIEVLDALIKRALIRSELDRLEAQVSGEEIDQAIDRIMQDAALPDREALRAQVEAEGTRWDVFREEVAERLRTQRFQQRVIGPRVVIREEEIEDLYQRTVRKGRATEAKISAMGIVIPPSADEATQQKIIAEAAKVVDAINTGALAWDKAVQDYDGAGLADIVGGRSYREGQLAGPINEVAFKADVGVVQPPVRVGNVLFVVRVDERGLGEGGVPERAELEGQLRDQLFQEKVGAVEEEWYLRARRQSAVDVLLGS